jgi:hypothetical protein
MTENTTPKETLHPGQVEEDLNIEPKHGSSPSTISDTTPKKIAPVSEDDLYSADETIGENKLQILEDVPSEKNKKRAKFEETVLKMQLHLHTPLHQPKRGNSRSGRSDGFF